MDNIGRGQRKLFIYSFWCLGGLVLDPWPLYMLLDEANWL